MKRSTRVKIFLSLTVVILIGLVSGYYMLFHNFEDEEVVLGIQQPEEEIDLTKVPYIDSLPPVVGYEGILYEYLIKPMSYSDSLELSLDYLEGPSWLSLNNSVLKGVPPVGSSGSYRIVLRVSDEYNSSIQEEYILIKEFEYENY